MKLLSKTKDKRLKGFIKLTRVHLSNRSIRKQPIMIAVGEIESFRPRNKLNGNHCTIVTTSGKYINVEEKFTRVQQLLR